MQYFISFLEGIITFISPCLLPMLPLYLSYFAGGQEGGTRKTLRCAFGFILGFTVVFMAMGALAGTFGSFVAQYQSIVNMICGIIVICFGLNYLGILKLQFFRGKKHKVDVSNLTFGSSIAFGIVFSIGWTPCVGAFLGTALLMASTQGQVLAGMVMLLTYSLGLGIPFLISAVLIDQLKGTFDWIKRNYGLINTVCGGFLILVGVMMATGTLGKLLAFLN